MSNECRLTILSPMQTPAKALYYLLLSDINSAVCLSRALIIWPYLPGPLPFCWASCLFLTIPPHNQLSPTSTPWPLLFPSACAPHSFPCLSDPTYGLKARINFFLFFFFSLCSLLWLIDSFLDGPCLRYVMHLLSLMSPWWYIIIN